MILRASLPFLTFVVWLLSVPMDGFLVDAVGISHPLPLFLIPHVVTMLFIAVLKNRNFLPFTTMLGGVISIISTVLLPYFAGQAAFILVLAGIGSAFLSIRAYCYLKQSPSPFASAATALIGANILLFLFVELPAAINTKFVLAALFLLVTLFTKQKMPMEKGEVNLRRFLPFAFVFQLISGFMYGSLFSRYQHVALVPGVELVFYVAAVGMALLLLKKQHTLLLALAIITAMFAFSVFLVPMVATVNLSYFLIQAAAGFYDFYLVTLLLSQRDIVRAFGLGIAVSCFGIICGKLVAISLPEVPSVLAALSNIVLIVSVLLLYRQMLAEQNAKQKTNDVAGLQVNTAKKIKEKSPVVIENPQQLQLVLPPNLSRLFSAQEKAVLACIVNGKTYKEAADELEISESTIKTYMKRIYVKLDISNKKQLFSRLDAYMRKV